MNFEKKFVKIFSIALALILVVAAVPVFQISAENTVLNDILLEDFDSLNNSNFSDVITGDSKYYSLSNSASQSGHKSLKISSAGMDLSGVNEKTYINISIDLPSGTGIGENYKGLKFWFKNDTEKALTVDIRTYDEDRLLCPSEYYLTDNTGATFACKTVLNSNFFNRGAIVLPVGFEGWAYIPYSSFNNVSYKKTRISICPLDISKGALYVDSIYSYVSLPEEIVYDSFENGFYNDEHGAISSISNEYSQHGQYSWKISTEGSTADENNKNHVGTRVSLNNKIPKDKNIKLWVKNTSSADVKVDFRTCDGGKLNEGAAYYLEDNVGSVKKETTVCNEEFWGRYALVIPRNFEGWLYIPNSSIFLPTDDFIYLSVRYDALKEGALYIDSIQSYSAAPAENFIENFDYGTTIPDTWTPYASVSDDYYHSGKNSLKVTTAGHEVSTEDILANYLEVFLIDNSISTMVKPDTNKTGFRMWIRNTVNSSVKLAVWTNGSNNMKPDATYYLQDDIGAVQSGTPVDTNFYGKRAVTLPANFEGWLYLPQSSFSEAGPDIRMVVHKSAINTGAIYIDSIQNYSGNPQVDLLENFDYNTNIITPDGIDIAEISTDYAVSGKNSLKISSQGMQLQGSYVGNYYYISVLPSSTAKGDTISGYKLWLKNTAGNDIKLDVRTVDTNQLRVDSPYYLVSTAGNTAGNKIVGNTEFYGRGMVRIPNDFEGWLYIPDDSFSNKNMDRVRFDVNPLEVKNGALYIDSIMTYTGNPAVLPYDANNDGVVDIRDLVRIKKYMADKNIFISFFAADSNGDSSLDTIDLVSLRKILLGVTET